MISICIPVYNVNITSLVLELEGQINQSDFDVELIVIDDKSLDKVRNQNNNCLKRHSYIQLNKNVGRSRIRNMFLDYSKYEHLLFLDCDVEIIKEDFLANYVKVLKQNSCDVVCGGLEYSKIKPLKENVLRWKFGNQRECRAVALRNENPYASFMTSNFVIKKKLLLFNPFDENLTKYGHEDTLLGFQLRLARKKIIHIQNPVLHADIESNINFLNKTEIAIQNLIVVYSTIDLKTEFSNSVKLLKFTSSMEKYNLNKWVLLFFTILKKPIFSLLKKGYTCRLFFFDFYKLGLICYYRNKTN